ncbi:hypothetical protein CRG98_008793 [Punica granatum]|uniref:Uncharacterized protein n=1 Tax=Punica granatum TaxID=22663 RepID=A0A2I0KQL3_PUNGR|nr:hypothetical protein CRG98_008793 [Punica granatum]
MKETTQNPRRVKEHSATPPRVRPRALLDPAWEPAYFGAKEDSLDPCGPKKLSATSHEEWLRKRSGGCARLKGSWTVTTFSRGRVGREGPFKCDGTTRRSRGKKWHVVEVRMHPMTVSGLDSFSGWIVMLKASN